MVDKDDTSDPGPSEGKQPDSESTEDAPAKDSTGKKAPSGVSSDSGAAKDPPSAGSAKSSSGGSQTPPPRRKGRMGIAVVMLLMGLVLGAAGAFFSGQTGLGDLDADGAPEPDVSTSPSPVIKEVTVDRPVTPQACISTVEEFSASFGDLEGARSILLEADVALASGDQEAAAEAHSKLDQLLRRRVIEFNAEPAQEAIAQCLASAESAGSPTPEASPTGVEETGSPGPGARESESPGPTPTAVESSPAR